MTFGLIIPTAILLTAPTLHSRLYGVLCVGIKILIIMADQKQIENSLIAAASEVQILIDQEFAKIDNKPKPGSNLDQIGLRDGKEIILEYIAVGEYAIALEHLDYMIKETNIPILEKTREDIFQTATNLQLPTIAEKYTKNTYNKGTLTQLTPLQKEDLKQWGKKREKNIYLFIIWAFIIMPVIFYILRLQKIINNDFSSAMMINSAMLAIIFLSFLIDIIGRKKCPSCNTKIGTQSSSFLITLPKRCDKCGVSFD